MFKAFENELQKQNCKYVVIKGDFRQRFNTAIHHVNALLEKLESMT
jgi:nicotinamide riboside kinase